jgi:hypothetical protein
VKSALLAGTTVLLVSACTTLQTESEAPAPGEAPPRNVVYEVEGTAAAANLTISDGNGSLSQQADVRLPLRASATSTEIGLPFTMQVGDFAQISAQNTGEKGSVTCRITVDGVVIDEVTSSGAYVIAACNATVP